MNFSRIIFSAALLCGVAGLAQARPNPSPKPSGTVYHLFGPNSIMSAITPGLPGETPKPATAQPGGAPQTDASAAQVAAAGGTAAGTPQTEQSDSPAMGAILHQMFVVGDPDHPIQPSIGRAADHPLRSN